jgi:hypothetical protein
MPDAKPLSMGKLVAFISTQLIGCAAWAAIAIEPDDEFSIALRWHREA